MQNDSTTPIIMTKKIKGDNFQFGLKDDAMVRLLVTVSYHHHHRQVDTLKHNNNYIISIQSTR